MQKWPFDEPAGYSPQIVQDAIKDKEWQKFRLSLKGVPTDRKLDMLMEYRERQRRTHWAEILPKKVEVQIANYLGALRRGGQLGPNNEVRKYI
jgi:hypothetical protein